MRSKYATFFLEKPGSKLQVQDLQQEEWQGYYQLEQQGPEAEDLERIERQADILHDRIFGRGCIHVAHRQGYSLKTTRQAQ
jgi:hypothetical protein